MTPKPEDQPAIFPVDREPPWIFPSVEARTVPRNLRFFYTDPYITVMSKLSDVFADPADSQPVADAKKQPEVPENHEHSYTERDVAFYNLGLGPKSKGCSGQVLDEGKAASVTSIVHTKDKRNHAMTRSLFSRGMDEKISKVVGGKIKGMDAQGPLGR
ncbi:hypothetical protein BS17DRAFT_817482 [Gyrodon lividus]|nr:hypothetical protein BS17DRAFT_817482 [Gyrodon lividus]